MILISYCFSHQLSYFLAIATSTQKLCNNEKDYYHLYKSQKVDELMQNFMLISSSKDLKARNKTNNTSFCFGKTHYDLSWIKFGDLPCFKKLKLFSGHQTAKLHLFNLTFDSNTQIALLTGQARKEFRQKLLFLLKSLRNFSFCFVS